LYSVADGLTVTVVANTPDGIGAAVLRMVMTGDNGIELRTPPGFLPGEPFPLDIIPGMPVVLNGMDLSSYFDPGQLEFSGMTQADYYEYGLPPGTYRVCFQAICPPEFCGMPVDYSRGPPAGCSNPIVIREVEPPTLLSPPCGTKLAAQPLQSVVFSWSPSPGSDPLTTTYRLQIVEMIEPDMPPQEALEAATTPVFFEREITAATSFWYGPTMSPLEPGRAYAWRVIAENRELHVPFAHGGASETCSFTYGDASPFLSPPLVVSSPPSPLSPPPPAGGPPPVVSGIGGWTQTPWAWVKGRLRVKFLGDTQTGGGTAPLLGNVSPAIPGATYYDKGSVSTAGSRPLGGIPVKLVVTYRLLDTQSMIGPLAGGAEVVLNKEKLVRMQYDPIGLEEAFPDIDRVVATTTTASDGSFSFQFIHALELGLVAENFSASPSWDPGPGWPGGPVISSVGAKKMTRTLRVVVDSPYYCSPDNDILVEPWQTKDVGTLVSLVKSYRYRVGVDATSFANNQAATGPMSGVTVSILRRNAKPAQLPEDEGDPSVHGSRKIGSHTYRVVARGTTNGQGEVTFHRLVAPASLNDAYWIYSETPKAAGVYNYKPYLRFDSGPLPAIHNRYLRWDRELLPEPELSSKTYLTPDHPRIVARTMDKAHDVAVSGAGVILTSRYKGTSGGGWLPWPQTKTTYRFGATNSQGYTWFEKLDVEEDANGGLVGPDRTLGAQKTGYEPWSTHLGILARGKQEIREINLQPDGLVLASVRDKETKQPLPAKGNFQGGVSVSTVPWNLFGSTSQVLLLQVAAGQNQTLEVVPFDSDYQPETFTIDVKPKGEMTILGPFEVTRRRHRIAVKVVRNPPSASFVPAQPLKDATVRILDMTEKTNTNGIATFVFDSNTNAFSARIDPPAQVDAVARTYWIFNSPTADMHTYTAKLAPATRIKGSVTVGDSIPVAGARVFLNNGSGPNVIPVETHTGRDGTFTLRNVPLDPPRPTVYAAKSSATATYVGASRRVVVPTQERIALDLTVYTDMDITRLLGFPIEITALEETAGGVAIDGSFTQLPAGADIAPQSSGVTMPFAAVALEAGSQSNPEGVPYAVPQSGPVMTMTPSLAVDVFSSFHGKLEPSSGSFLRVEDAGGGSGVVRGTVRLLDDSFAFSKNEASFPPLHLTPFGESSSTVTALRADPTAAPAVRFGVGTSGNTLSYELYGFDATSTPAAVTLSADSL
ncbi:carboxypeptidase-like regulatory domain-containing protein, partial [bacterium]|nr:carboxypeptidase-like regulatory domain-containing protein [bacterium]